MRTEEIIIKGMNRKNNSTEDNNGLCEEIINIRPENGSIKILGQKQVVSANLPFTEIKIHNIGNMDNYIGIYTEGGTNKIIWFDKDTGSILQEIYSSNTNLVRFNFLNNMLVICDKESIDLHVFLFTDNRYKIFYKGIDIEIKSSFSSSKYQIEPEIYVICDIFQPENKMAYIEAASSSIRKFQDENIEYTEGDFLYALTFTLFDNSEVQSNISAIIQNKDTSDNTNIDFIEPFKFLHAQYMHLKIHVENYYLKYTLSLTYNSSIAKYNELIKCVNLYVSKPRTNLPIDTARLTGKWIFGDEPGIGGDSFFQIQVPGLKNRNISKEILYKQKSWNLEEISKGISYTLKFGVDIQTTGKTLKVSANNINRAGEIFVYNNRLHLYNTKAKLNIRLRDIQLFKEGEEIRSGVPGRLFVYLRLEHRDVIIKYTDIFLPSITRLPPYILDTEAVKEIILPMVIYPDSRAYKLILELNGKYIPFLLSSSESYNYSYCFPLEYDLVSYSEFEVMETSNIYDESNVINVTASGNPFVFPVEHSYRFDGKINDIGIVTEQISDSQIGQYPLEVFTDSGIYALEQGTGTVLYSNIVPINSDRARDIAQTRHGIIYIANDSIYLLSGRKSLKLSEVLEGPIDFDIQNNSSYALCCQGKLYDVSDHLSKIPFKEYLKAAELSYCANTEELIISNPGHMYTYVYSFLYNAWYKLSGQYKGIKNNLLLRPVAQNTQSAKAATGSIVFENICLEKAKSFTSQCSIEFQLKSSCNAGDVVALLVDGKQIASAKFTYATKIPIIIAKLCGNIPYLEDYTYLTTDPGEVYKIHCSLSMAGKRVEIKNVNSGEFYLSKLFVQDSRVVNIGNKGYGSTITVKIGSATHAIVINNGDSIITLLNKLASEINSSTQVSAAVYANEITLTAKTSGAIGNSISLSVYNDIYTQITTRAMTGGEDISLRPSDYREIVNFSEEESGTQIIHLQTRPMLLSSTGYKALYRAMLRCKASLSGEDNLSMYIYASNNLKDWKCVQAAQRKNCTISALIVDKVYQAYKYYVLMIGGKVSNATELSSILVSLEDKLNNKLR